MFIDKRQLAVGACGFSAFTNLYPVQALLPDLAREFAATPLQLGLTVAVSILAVALMAPFVGVLSDRLGRRPMILGCLFLVALGTLTTGLAWNVESLIVWRFLTGLFIPGIFTTTLAYIREEWSPREAVETSAIYISGTVLGGFSGRLIAGFGADLGGWQMAFALLGGLDLLLVPLVYFGLPASRNFRPGGALTRAFSAMAAHMRNPRLRMSYGVGFILLFSLVAVFTFVSLHLTQPPYGLGPALIGGIFAVYLLGVVTTPLAGRQVARFGRGPVAFTGAGISLAGLLITLLPALPLIILGLALCSAGIFVIQGLVTGYVAQVAERNTSAAVGLYVTIYYIGGSVGALAPSLAWAQAGWPGCVTLVALVLLVLGWLVRRLWGAEVHAVQTGSGP